MNNLKAYLTRIFHFSRMMILFALVTMSSTFVCAQDIPTNKVIEPANLSDYLEAEVKSQISSDNIVSQEELAAYFRDKFAERYFFNWNNFNNRFETYKALYDNSQSEHASRAKDHMNKYSDSTQWVLPFNYLNGEPVNAYALRHLARQHKMVDVAFQYYYENNDPLYIQYFIRQVKSLNVALGKDEYEKIEDGNGVYEAFRSGYRALNWLEIHNLFLGQKAYDDEAQLTTIATLLQQGAHLYKTNSKFQSGNHQTRGMSALAMISILLRDFEGTDLWYNHSMNLLEEHLAKEINDDGFQFERTVHYHMSDISNYYYVYQLAKLSKLEVKPFWENKLRSLFTTLVKIAYPDKWAPVLQDDTEITWAEKNNISGALTLGYLLFNDPEMGYFANKQVGENMYWFISNEQLTLLNNIEKQKPQFKSLSFPTTGYYVMREGWDLSDDMMIISAGLDDKKPDHQHGDMLGIQAMSNGKVILPNYQVRYPLKDFYFFKNSMVKNVALVDDELQGKQWTGNQGGSGFGKFRELPNPKTIAWQTSSDVDFYVGSHDGFENIGVAYSRQVIYVRGDFWIVKDNFEADKAHDYKQVWQGHYTLEQQPNLIRSTFDDASACDVYQLVNTDEVINGGTRGKGWSVVAKKNQKNFSFITVIFPYSGNSSRINEDDEKPTLKGWSQNQSTWESTGENVISLSKDKASFLFGVKSISYGDLSISFSETSDVYVKLESNQINLQLIGDKVITIELSAIKKVRINEKAAINNLSLVPGDWMEIQP